MLSNSSCCQMKVVPKYHATKANRVNGGEVPGILDLSTRWSGHEWPILPSEKQPTLPNN